MWAELWWKGGNLICTTNWHLNSTLVGLIKLSVICAVINHSISINLFHFLLNRHTQACTHIISIKTGHCCMIIVVSLQAPQLQLWIEATRELVYCGTAGIGCLWVIAHVCMFPHFEVALDESICWMNTFATKKNQMLLYLWLIEYLLSINWILKYYILLYYYIILHWIVCIILHSYFMYTFMCV